MCARMCEITSYDLAMAILCNPAPCAGASLISLPVSCDSSTYASPPAMLLLHMCLSSCSAPIGTSIQPALECVSPCYAYANPPVKHAQASLRALSTATVPAAAHSPVL